MQLTDKQINVIHWDLRHSGVTCKELRDDLFDHLCCLVEKELETEPDFKAAYLKVRKRFGSFRLLQVKTNREVEARTKFELFIKGVNYVYVCFYLFIGLLFFVLPVICYLSGSGIIIALCLLPVTVLGFVISFTRINYRTFDIIPFKKGFSPVKITF